MPKKTESQPLSPEQYSLELTGDRGTDAGRHQFHLVVFGDTSVRLTNGPFVLLLELARARIETHSGYFKLPRNEDPDALRLGIHRLRRQIDACLGSGVGVEVVQTGIGSEYRLSVPPGNIRVDRGFPELPQTFVVADLRDFLENNCPAINVEEVREIGSQRD